MNLEVEVKIRVKDLSAVKKRLKSLGAKFLGQVRQVDTYYALSPKARKHVYDRLRIRQDLTRKLAFMEYHVPCRDYRKRLSAKEYEIRIDDPKIGDFIVKKLGFPVDVIIDKTREKYSLGKINIDLDTVKGLGKFVEVEIMNQNYARAQKEIYAMIEKLGLDKKQELNGLTYLDLAWEKEDSRKKRR